MAQATCWKGVNYMPTKRGSQHVSDDAKLIAEWNYERNTDILPDQISFGSSRKVWWKCEKGHEWQASANNRSKGSGCPYCSNSAVLQGYNDLVTMNPGLASEWNSEKNSSLKPTEVTTGSHRIVWWKCKHGHEWQAQIKSRDNGNGCPYCSGRFVITGKNDLQTINPALSKEWNYEKNNGLSPSDVLPNSGRIVWWKCNKGHEWQTKVSDRAKGGCPYCSGQRILKGFNDLQTVNPTLAKEWNYERNGNLKPEDVTANNGKKVWWICSKGHEWQAKIYHRNNGSGCPICSSERNTSLPEYILLFYLRKHGISVIHSYKGKGYELDIYIPTQRTAIEFDGYFWHKHKRQKDLEKNSWCERDGIKLYRIREGLPSLNTSSIDYVIQKDHKDLSLAIESILRDIVEANVDVNLERDSIDIENLREYTEKESSVLFLNPEIAAEWNYEKNGKIRPEYFALNSAKKVWWKCEKGHEWQAIIQSRNRGNGCPYCSGLIAIPGENDLKTVNPDLSQEWNFEKNGDLSPADVLPNSEKKVWWRCQSGHEWQATIGNRNKGQGCPYCSGRKTLKGYNDLQTVNPELAKEWNRIKNQNLNPTDVTAGSNKKVWWICEKGHEWQAMVCDRTRGNGCPYCSGQRILKGYNDLQTVNPILSSEWNYGKNVGLTPEEITPNSNKQVWWKCHTCSYEWRTSVYNRNHLNTGCPRCAKKRAAQALSHRVVQLSPDNQVIAEFGSIAEAERETGIKHISSACRGDREKAGGYIWKYVE